MPLYDLEDLGPMVRRHRSEHKLSLREASEESGVPFSTLSRIEKGRLPDLVNFQRIVEWLGVPVENFRWSGELPKTLESSKGVKRHFCETCGSPMGFEADHYLGGMHLYAASLEDPDDFEPMFHVNYESRLPWFRINDDLPKYEGTLLQAPAELRKYKSTK